MNIEQIVKLHNKIFIDTFDEVCCAKLEKIGILCSKAISDGGKLIFMGNGGSASDSQHIAAEFISKLAKDRKPLPALSLTVDTSAITAIGNDYGFEYIFSRQIEALGNKHDIIFGISTSGKSVNVKNGFNKAKSLGIKSVALTGKDGFDEFSPDYTINVQSSETARIQEAHIFIGHIICMLAEKNYV